MQSIKASLKSKAALCACVCVCLPVNAGDLPGMRLAADRIAKSLQRLDYADAPVWQAAQQRLLEQLMQQLGLAEPGSSGSSDGITGSGIVGGSSAGLGLQLAAVAEQAAAALPELPLEEDGHMYEEPKPKVGAGCCGCWSCYCWLCRPCRCCPAAGRCRVMQHMQRSALLDTLPVCLPFPLPLISAQASVAKPENVIDVSDLDPAFPR
jgi:hypothetical protein